MRQSKSMYVCLRILTRKLSIGKFPTKYRLYCIGYTVYCIGYTVYSIVIKKFQFSWEEEIKRKKLKFELRPRVRIISLSEAVY